MRLLPFSMLLFCQWPFNCHGGLKLTSVFLGVLCTFVNANEKA